MRVCVCVCVCLCVYIAQLHTPATFNAEEAPTVPVWYEAALCG